MCESPPPGVDLQLDLTGALAGGQPLLVTAARAGGAPQLLLGDLLQARAERCCMRSCSLCACASGTRLGHSATSRCITKHYLAGTVRFMCSSRAPPTTSLPRTNLKEAMQHIPARSHERLFASAVTSHTGRVVVCAAWAPARRHDAPRRMSDVSACLSGVRGARRRPLACLWRPPLSARRCWALRRRRWARRRRTPSRTACCWAWRPTSRCEPKLHGAGRSG